jgi:cation diffusion facilitator family transporter
MMHSNFIDPWTQNHTFLGRHHSKHEQRTWSVVALTAVMMVVEIAGGTVFGSLALVADGWHMATHVAALAIAALAYLFARRHASDARFSLGTGKFGELAAFGSAIILGMIALGIAYDSLLRLGQPVVISFQEAIPIAALGLCVNFVSAWLLRDEHGHSHDHAQAHDHDHGHEHNHAAHGDGARTRDINLRAAYVHVVADALISILAIAGLSVAWAFGWNFIDPLVGLVGAVVIASWSFSLLRAAGCVLLDTVPSPDLAERIRRRMELDGDRVCDLHVWQVGPGHLAVMASIVSEAPQPPSVYKQRLADLTGLSHVTVEVHANTP